MADKKPFLMSILTSNKYDRSVKYTAIADYRKASKKDMKSKKK